MTEPKIVRKDYPGSYYDIRGLEEWLTKLAKSGVRLERQMENTKRLEFRQAQSANVRFLLIPDIRKKDKRTCEDLRHQYTEQGWEFICRIPGQVIIYETEDLWAVKPAVALAEEDYRRKWRSLLVNVIAWLVLIAVMFAFVAWGLLSESVTYYERITVWPWVFGGSVLLPVILALLDVSEIYDLYVWWKHYRQREEVPQWQAAKTLRRTKRVGAWVVFAVTLLVPFLELVMGNVTYRGVENLEEEQVPAVTLQLLDENYVLEFCGVYEKSHLLIPDEIGVRTSREKGNGWLDNMVFTYYRLRSETMAYRLAESESVEMTPWGYGAAVPVESNSGFDAVWLSDGEDFQYLVACVGDVAITIEQSSDNDLMAVLPEIYDIVAEYRANT